MSTDVQDRVGPFRIVSEIGKGSMGTVYLARKGSDLDLGRPVALKLLHPEHLRDAANLKAFIREASIGIYLNHHNVVAVQELLPDGAGGYAIAMEFVDGVDLRAVLKHQGALARRMPLSVALEVLEQACLGLDHAHQPDASVQRPPLVHRDFKPANVMLTRSGLVKVMDFGIALLDDVQAGEDNGTGSTIKGTPRYMSPEQARGLPLTPASDIFSAGLVLYECTTGERFYREPDFLALLREAQAADVGPCLKRASSLPRPVLAILKRALDADPSRRFPRAMAMADELRSARRKIREEESLAVFAARICDSLAQGDRTDPTRTIDNPASASPRPRPVSSLSTLVSGLPTTGRASPAPTGNFPVAGALVPATTPPPSTPIGSASHPPASHTQARLDSVSIPSATGSHPGPAAAPLAQPESRRAPARRFSPWIPLVLSTAAMMVAAGLVWAAVLVRAPEATPRVRFFVDPQTATVLVDGRAQAPSTEYFVDLPDGGQSTVVVHAPGYEVRTIVLTGADRERARLISLEPKTR